jgi:hypothetical protein
VGALLSALIYIFWPQSQEDVWSEIEGRVQQLINQDLTDLVKAQVAASLDGLNSNLNDWRTARDMAVTGVGRTRRLRKPRAI